MTSGEASFDREALSGIPKNRDKVLGLTSCEASVDREALSGLHRKIGTRSLACLVFEASSNGEAPYIQEQGSWPVLFLVLKQVEVENKRSTSTSRTRSLVSHP